MQKFGATIKDIMMPYTTTNEEALRVAQDLEEWLSKEKNLDQEIVNITRGFINQVRSSEVDKNSIQQYSDKQKYQLAKATQNDDGSLKQEIKDYEASLKKEKELSAKYTKETNLEKKQELEKQLAEQYEITAEALERIKGLYNRDDGDQSTLSQDIILNYLGIDGTANNESQIKNNIYASPLSEEQIQAFERIKKELKETGILSDTSRKELAELKKFLLDKDDGQTWIEAINNSLDEVGNKSKINLDKNNLRNEYNQKRDNAAVKGYMAKTNNKEVMTKEYEKQMGYWLSGVDASLNSIGLNTGAKWYQDLSKQLKNGEIDFETFYNTVSTNCEKLGIDLNDLKDAVSEVTEEVKMLGSQSEFLSEMESIEDLYDKAAKIKSGKSLDAKDILELRNQYEEVNEYIAETGDLTLKNGQLLMDLGDEAYNTGEEALRKQIENLEDYQDAILNTVDAMGIMAEFKEELAKLDNELAETITDNAIAEAQAEGMYVDFTKEGADGIYEAKESVMMANDALYTKEQADIQGILDAKAVQNEVEQAYADQTLAIDEAIQASDAATAEQKADSAQWIIDSKVAEGEVTSGVADVESQAESSSAQATAEGANSKADSQEVAAKAAITTGQAFIEMARDIAKAEGIEVSGLDEAAGKLEQLQGQLDKVSEDKKTNAQKAAAAYAEAQKKIQEAKARLGQYKGINTQGRGNYNAASPKGSRGSGSGSSNNYTPDDAADDLKEILNSIDKYEADIEVDLEDQTEELINHYNLEKNKLDTLKEELDYYDNIYDVTEKTTKWLETQMKILDEESKKVAEMQNSNEKIMAQREKIFKENSGYNVASWFDSEMNETLAYGDLLNSFEYRIEEVQKETAQKMRDVYNGVANSTDKDTIAKAKEKIKNIEDEGDLRVKELEKEKEKVENIYNSVEQLNDAWKGNRDAIRDALQELNERVLSVRDELVDDIMEQLERAVDKMNTSIEKDVTRLEQLKTIQESYNSILNDTIETQQSLDDELRANLDTYQYLDEEMRQLMFNEDDYKQLSGVLEGVQQDIADIWEDHYNQIQDLTEDEMYKAEYITNETERQLAAKEKEYALAKAELEVAKAQTQLDNVLNERNTRIFANGEWSWVNKIRPNV